MKVIYEGDPNIKTFGEVGVGETFAYDDCVFLKIEPAVDAVVEGYNRQVNTVDLESGETYGFNDNDEVRVVKSKVIVYGEKE